MGNRCHDLFADAGDGEREEDHAVDEHHAEGLGPRDALAEHDCEGEERVDAHAGSEGDRVVGQKRHDHRGERGGERGYGDKRALVHAGVGQDVGVDDQNVGHRGEGRQAGLEFAADGGFMAIELEETLQHGRWYGRGGKK